jgi:hypothetical protein
VTKAATRIAACLTLLSLTSGCSFVFVSGPKEVEPGRYEPDGCTTSKMVPVIDAFVTLFNASGVVYALTLGEQESRAGGINREANVGLGVALTLLFAASGLYGQAVVAHCREITRAAPLSPYRRPDVRTSRQRRADEAAEEAAVQAQMKAKAAEDAAEAKAAGEAAGAAAGHKPATAKP